MLRTRCAIVGAGRMGRWHADAARRAGAEVAFIVDTDRERALQLAGRLRLPASAVSASIGPVLEASACDALHVCTGTSAHIAVVREALLAGKHVLVEKPLAETERETADLLNIAGSRGLRLVPVHQFLFQSGVVRALNALPSLGRPLHLDFVACSAGAAGKPGEADRIAEDILPHALALTARVIPGMGDALEWSGCRAATGELRLLGRSGAVTVGVTVSMAGRPTRAGATIICTAGTVHLDFFHGYAVVERGRASRSYKVLRPFALTFTTLGKAAMNLSRRAAGGERAYPGLRELVRRFYASMQDGYAAPVSAEETLAVARARDRALAALEESDVPTHRSAVLA